MKKLWVLLVICGWVIAKPLLVAVVHPDCSHCQAWEEAWENNQGAIKDQVSVRLVDVTKFDDVTWVSQHFSGALTGGTPHFMVAKSDVDFNEMGRFIGFSNWARFEKQLMQILQHPQEPVTG